MSLQNRMTMSVTAKSGNEAFIRGAAAAFCVPLNPTLETINDIKTAVSEAVTNVIVHAYDEPEKNLIHIEAELFDDSLSIIIRDDGRGIADVGQAMQPMYTSKPEKERSGMGFTFMQTFTDELEVTSAVGGGTTVKMKKYIRSR
ncbi:MAG: anti-sigma F factor [Clostridiales bacterium]|jgi:stage II sporulation protein AB (anti-sigma F factor)|nr:anti-sigma F factor [Clostridiales bacterium]